MKPNDKLLSLLLCVVLIVSLCGECLAVSEESELDTALEAVCAYTYGVVPSPNVSTVAGEWTVIGLARSGFDAPQSYWDNYYARLCRTVEGKEGILSPRRYTEYTRVVLALTAIGADPANVAGYDLLARLGETENVLSQGLNGAIWALIALDAGEYTVTVNGQDVREIYLQTVLSAQRDDGGWGLSSSSDADVTAMALTALASYRDRETVQEAVDKGVVWLSENQMEDGGFGTAIPSMTPTAESCAQTITAMAALGISPDDARFVKNGNTVLDALLAYQLASGGFRHTKQGSVNQTATEQALCALCALSRAQNGQNGIYQMRDTELCAVPFTDVYTESGVHWGYDSITYVFTRGLMRGTSFTTFDPERSVTRGMLVTILYRLEGEPEAEGTASFQDVGTGDWYCAPVTWAAANGIVNGYDASRFGPNDAVTREQFATILYRYTAFKGGDAGNTADLSAYEDSGEISDWARDAMRWAVGSGLIHGMTANTLVPSGTATRAQAATILKRYLEA